MKKKKNEKPDIRAPVDKDLENCDRKIVGNCGEQSERTEPEESEFKVRLRKNQLIDKIKRTSEKV